MEREITILSTQRMIFFQLILMFKNYHVSYNYQLQQKTIYFLLTRANENNLSKCAIVSIIKYLSAVTYS